MQIVTMPAPMSPEVIDDRVATVLNAGTNITLTYDDAANVLTIDAAGGGAGYTDEQAQDAIGNILQDSATIDYVYNDATPYITGLVKDNSITEAMLSLNDNTTQNVSITRHGFVPKAPNNTTQYLDGTGAWSVPAGGGSGTSTPIGVTVNRASAFSVPATTLTAIPFDTEVIDEGGFWSSGQNTRIIIPSTGWYTVTASANWDSGSASRIIYIRLNNTTMLAEQSSSGVSDLRQNISVTYRFTAGHYVEIFTFVGAASTLDTATCSVSTLTSGSVSDSPAPTMFLLMGA